MTKVRPLISGLHLKLKQGDIVHIGGDIHLSIDRVNAGTSRGVAITIAAPTQVDIEVDWLSAVQHPIARDNDFERGD